MGGAAEPRPSQFSGTEAWPRQRYAELGAQIARELAEVHRAGTIIGCLRPEHITLNLADYPSIEICEEAPCAPYAAPEARGGTATRESNVYSLGAVLFFLFSGEHPPPGGALDDDALGHAPEGVAAIVRSCLSTRPGERPALARVASDLMRCALNDQTVSVDSDAEWEALSGTRPVLHREIARHSLSSRAPVATAPTPRSRGTLAVGLLVVAIVCGVVAYATGHLEVGPDSHDSGK